MNFGKGVAKFERICLGSFAFWDCKKLKKATIERGVKNISDGMFCATALKKSLFLEV